MLPQKELKIQLLPDPAIPLLGRDPKELRQGLRGVPVCHVHSGTLRASQEVEATQVWGGWGNRMCLPMPWNTMQPLKRRQSCCLLEHGRALRTAHSAKWPVLGEQTLPDPTRKKNRNQSESWRQRAEPRSPEAGTCCFMGRGSLWEGEEVCGRTVVTAVQQ